MADIKHASMREDFSRVNTRSYSEERTALTIQMALDAIGGLPRTLLLADEDDGLWTLEADVTIPPNVFLEVPLGVTITGPGDLIILGGIGGLRYPLHIGPGVIEWEGSPLAPRPPIWSWAIAWWIPWRCGRTSACSAAWPLVIHRRTICRIRLLTCSRASPWRWNSMSAICGDSVVVSLDSTMHANSPTHLAAMNPNCGVDPHGWHFTGVAASVAGNIFIHSTIGGTVDNCFGIYGAVFNVSPGRVINACCVVAHEIPYAWNNGPITNYMGIYVMDTIRGDNTYGIYSVMSARAKKWNLFCQGSAVNYMAAGLAIASAGGVPPAGYLLHVNGNAGKPGGGSWSDVSSQRLKTNIQSIPGALDTMLALRGHAFEWAEEAHARLLPGTQYGLLAEEVEAVLPGWVETTEEDEKVLTIRGFEALTIESLRTIVARLTALEEAPLMATVPRFTVMREDVSQIYAREYGVGQDSATVQAALLAIGTARRCLVLSDDAGGVWTWSTHITVPANVTLVVPVGVVVTGVGNCLIQGGLIALRSDWWQSSGTLTWLGAADLWHVPRLRAGASTLESLLLPGTPLAISEGGTEARTVAQVRTNLGLVIGSTVQAYDPALQSLAHLTTVPDTLPYVSAVDTFSACPFSAFARTFVACVDPAAARTALVLGALATQSLVTTPLLGDRAVSYAKVQEVAGLRLLGNTQTGAAVVQEIGLGSGLQFSSGLLMLTGAALTGAGSDGAVALWSGPGSMTYDGGLVWNRATHRLGINIAPTYPLHVSGDAYIVGAFQATGAITGQSGSFVTNLGVNQDLFVTRYCQFANAVGIGRAPDAPRMLRVNGEVWVDGMFNVPNVMSATPGGTIYMALPLGLGMAAPATHSLDVQGEAWFYGLVNLPSCATFYLADGRSYLVGPTGIGQWPPDAGVHLHVGGNVRINNAVGIGTAYNPSYSLTMAGYAYFMGNIGVGRTPNPASFTAAFVSSIGLDNGGGFQPGGGPWYNLNSSRILKRNIQPLSGALDALLQLQEVTWEWATSEMEGKLPGPQVGLVVEDVEAALPYWVTTMVDGTKALQEKGHVAYTVGALRELHARLAAVEQQLAALLAQ